LTKYRKVEDEGCRGRPGKVAEFAGVRNYGSSISGLTGLHIGRFFGVVIEEPLILARAVFVIDADGFVQYEDVVPEISNEPDYAAAMAALKSLLPQKPAGQKRQAARKRAPVAPKRATVAPKRATEARKRPAARAEKAAAGRRRR
jgi:hypothetical protein